MTISKLEIRTLGASEVCLDGKPVPKWRAGKTLKLFQYLAVRGGQIIPRSQLVDVLWPEGSQSGGNASLKVAIHGLRRVLMECEAQAGRPVATIRYAEFGYELVADDIWVDVNVFSSLVRAAENAEGSNNLDLAKMKYSQAAELYRGPFLPDEDSCWAREERMWAESLCVKVLNRLASITAAEGKTVLAIDFCRRALALDPYNEEMYRLMMEIHGNSKELGMALRWYSECDERMRAGLGVEPSDQTRDSLVRVLTECDVSMDASAARQLRLGEKLATHHRMNYGAPRAQQTTP